MLDGDKDEILSVIIPAYNEELMIDKAYERIDGILRSANIPNKIVFIDDGLKYAACI